MSGRWRGLLENIQVLLLESEAKCNYARGWGLVNGCSYYADGFLMLYGCRVAARWIEKRHVIIPELRFIACSNVMHDGNTARRAKQGRTHPSEALSLCAIHMSPRPLLLFLIFLFLICAGSMKRACERQQTAMGFVERALHSVCGWSFLYSQSHCLEWQITLHLFIYFF